MGDFKSNISSILSWRNISLYEAYTIEPSFSPELFECFLIFISFIIFVVGITGNFLVVFVVLTNSHMKTITNMFIVNLAIGDLMVTVICLPPTILTDITGNWYFGQMMCKIIPYVQYISVSVSVMTLTSISYERYYAIVYPLKFVATKFRAKIIILIVWVISLIMNLPPPIVITMNKDNETNTFYCIPTWPSIYQNMFDTLIILILYILPMALIFYTYTSVIKVLWKIDKSIAWESSSSSTTKKLLNKKQKNGGNQICNDSKSTVKQTSYNTTASGSSVAKTKMKQQLSSRRKAAKMLISVAIMFAICYLPIHVLNIIRFIYPESPFLNNYAHIMYKIAHILVYINSSMNPLIYNFMSDNFRKEFKRTLFCRKSNSKNNLKVTLSNTQGDFSMRNKHTNVASNNSISTTNNKNSSVVSKNISPLAR